MSFYLVPNILNNFDINDFKLDVVKTSELEHGEMGILNNSLQNYLYSIKKEIHNNDAQWDNYKKIVNPYEYLHTPIPCDKKQSICKYKPLSRSYFKMIEITKMMDLLDDFDGKDIRSFHLCEGPGGFIEALAGMRDNPNDDYTGMTLISDTEHIPGWKKSKDFLSKNPNVTIEYGEDETGNIFNPANFHHCSNKYSNSMDIITADGGFDFSVDFNMQEYNALNLIFCQVLYALIMQKHGGHFVLKVFDVFSAASLDLCYLLSSFYGEVYIVKPNTSRYANSERYIVCKHFKLESSKEFSAKFHASLSILYKSELSIKRLIRFSIPYYFLTKIEEINAIFGQQQIETINNTLTLINMVYPSVKQEKTEYYKKNNIQKCINWCIKYKVPYNKIMSTSSNIFQ